MIHNCQYAVINIRTRQTATNLSNKNVLRLKILVDNSLVMDTVECRSKTAPEVICDM